MIVLKYEDEKNLFYYFKYLKEFYGFNPPIINIDYSLSLEKVLNEKELFTIKTKIIKFYFFHFSQSVMRKMKSLKLLNKIKKK